MTRSWRDIGQAGIALRRCPGRQVKRFPVFVAFFNRAAAFSDALYSGGSSTPKFAYILKTLPSNVEDDLKIGNQTMSGTGSNRRFTWTGAPEDVQVTTHGGDTLGSFKGPWSVFRFVADAHAQSSGHVTNLEWIMQSNGRTIMLPNGKPKSYDYQLNVTGVNPFQSSELTGVRCVPQVAH